MTLGLPRKWGRGTSTSGSRSPFFLEDRAEPAPRRVTAGHVPLLSFASSGSTKQQRREAEEAAINLVIERLAPAELEDLVRGPSTSLPEPIVRRNPTLSNPFVRGKVYELACGEPLS